MAKPKFKDNEQVKGRVLKRSRRRVKALVGAGKMPRGVSPKHGISGKEARALKAAMLHLQHGRGPAQPHRAPAAGYDPLAPLTGKDFKREERAAEGYEFGDQARELRKEGSRLEQNAANVGSYYDDYRNALTQSVGRIRNDADATAAATQTQVDRSKQQDQSRLEAADAEAAATAAKFGRPSTPSDEGQRALEARQFMGQSEQARMRERADAQVREADLRIPNSVLAKAERLREEERRVAANRGDQRRLTQKRGEFATKYRADTRASEREWAAVKKEFKLKDKDITLRNKASAADRKVEKIKSYNQLKQAILYAGAKTSMANALMRQAKTMADAKIISAGQYKEIARINAGASNRRAGAQEHVAETYAGGKGGAGTRTLQPYEKDRVDRATNALAKFHKQGSLTGTDRNGKGYTAFIRRMRSYGIQAQYARIAWKRYWDKHPASSGGGGQPGAPHGGTRTN